MDHSYDSGLRTEHRTAETKDAASRSDEPMRIPVITQNRPDSRRIEPSAENEPVSQQKLEQDVIATNPSVESMESRG